MGKKNIIVSGGFDWKITALKGLKSFGIVLLTGLIVVWQNDPRYLALIPLVEMILNFVKHYDF